jgi:putative transcriptional regulator
MDNYNWQYVMKIDPFAKEEDVIEIKEINEWDLLITFKNGKKFIYDTFTNYYRGVFYETVDELTDEQEKKEFSRRLRILMKRKFITQEQLAELLGMTQTMISRYINGKALPSVLVVRKIAKILDCSMDELFYQEY